MGWEISGPVVVARLQLPSCLTIGHAGWLVMRTGSPATGDPPKKTPHLGIGKGKGEIYEEYICIKREFVVNDYGYVWVEEHRQSRFSLMLLTQKMPVK